MWCGNKWSQKPNVDNDTNQYCVHINSISYMHDCKPKLAKLYDFLSLHMARLYNCTWSIWACVYLPLTSFCIQRHLFFTSSELVLSVLSYLTLPGPVFCYCYLFMVSCLSKLALLSIYLSIYPSIYLSIYLCPLPHVLSLAIFAWVVISSCLLPSLI